MIENQANQNEILNMVRNMTNRIEGVIVLNRMETDMNEQERTLVEI